MTRRDALETPAAVAESAELNPIIPTITEGDVAALAETELQSMEDLDILRNAIPREFHPKAIKKEYRLKAILWSIVLAAVIVSGMIGDRNKWGSMVNNVLRMMSGQAMETAGVPDQIPHSASPKDNTPPEVEVLPPTTTPPPTEEMIVTPEATPSADRLIYPANNLVNDETLCRNSSGSYRAVVEPIVVDGLELFRITVVPLDKNGEKNIPDMMLPVIDPAERVHDAAKCLEGMPNGEEGEMTYYIPVDQSEKASLRDTSELKVVDRNNFYYYFPGLVVVDEKGEQHPSDEGSMGFLTFKNPSSEYTNTALSDLQLP